MAEIKAGDSVEVMDLSDLKTPKRPKFAKGARLTVKKVWPGGLEFVGHPGIWNTRRFERRAHG